MYIHTGGARDNRIIEKAIIKSLHDLFIGIKNYAIFCHRIAKTTRGNCWIFQKKILLLFFHVLLSAAAAAQDCYFYIHHYFMNAISLKLFYFILSCKKELSMKWMMVRTVKLIFTTFFYYIYLSPLKRAMKAKEKLK